jgi:hypothetical protein
MSYIRQYSLKDCDVKAAIAAFLYEHPDLGAKEDLRIHPKLLFHGAKNSKILHMDKEDQDRLLSNEKFQVVQPNGKPCEPKTWSELNEVHRNTLIGKGGKILSVQEQLAERPCRKNVAVYPLGSVEKKGQNAQVLVSRDGNMQLQVTWADYTRMLQEADCLEDLKKAIREVNDSLDDGLAACG